MKKFLLVSIFLTFAGPLLSMTEKQLNPELQEYLPQKLTKEFEKQQAYKLQRQQNIDNLKKMWNFTKVHKYQLLTGLGLVGLGVAVWRTDCINKLKNRNLPKTEVLLKLVPEKTASKKIKSTNKKLVFTFAYFDEAGTLHKYAYQDVPNSSNNTLDENHDNNNDKKEPKYTVHKLTDNDELAKEALDQVALNAAVQAAQKQNLFLNEMLKENDESLSQNKTFCFQRCPSQNKTSCSQRYPHVLKKNPDQVLFDFQFETRFFYPHWNPAVDNQLLLINSYWDKDHAPLLPNGIKLIPDTIAILEIGQNDQVTTKTIDLTKDFKEAGFPDAVATIYSASFSPDGKKFATVFKISNCKRKEKPSGKNRLVIAIFDAQTMQKISSFKPEDSSDHIVTWKSNTELAVFHFDNEIDTQFYQSYSTYQLDQ